MPEILEITRSPPLKSVVRVSTARKVAGRGTRKLGAILCRVPSVVVNYSELPSCSQFSMPAWITLRHSSCEPASEGADHITLSEDRPKFLHQCWKNEPRIGRFLCTAMKDIKSKMQCS